MGQLHDPKLCIFMNFYSSNGKNPRMCGIGFVLHFLQEGLDRHLSASTLKVLFLDETYAPFLPPIFPL